MKRKTENGKWRTENGKRFVFFLMTILLCCISVNTAAQTKLSKEELANYEVEIQKMVHYLQETLNFIGDPEQTAQEKEIVFSQSYTKIFQDNKVQIEDDLDTKRSTTLSKDVQAYLKDIDFFFQYAQFTFDIQSITNLSKQDGSPYFKVTLNRKLVGKTVTNDSINEVKNRFIEINLDKKNNDLKIASIYTTKINERQSLRYWWNAMPSAWKNFFGDGVNILDTIPLKSVMLINENDFIYSYPVFAVPGDESVVSDWKETIVKTGMDELYAQLKTLSQTQQIDVADVKTITTLDPLAELSDLVRLDISGTNVNDFTPLRNANKLKVLRAADTRINDLMPLKYDLMLEELNIANTDIEDLSLLEVLSHLEKLTVDNTPATDFSALEYCPDLTYLSAEGCRLNHLGTIGKLDKLVALNVSNTRVKDLNPLSNLKALQSLKISSTNVNNLKALEELENLKELFCSNTNVSDLSPLQHHRRLSKIYCDNTRIDVHQASAFSKENPFTLVIYDTNALEEWWNNLPIYWKAVFSQQIQLADSPSTEQLHEVINMTDLDLSGNSYIQNLMPVSRLTNLVNLNIANTEITRLDALSGMTNLENINLENTYVNDLRPLVGMFRLKTLNISNTPVTNLTMLVSDNHLETILAYNTSITQDEVNHLKESLRDVTVVFQTDELTRWWDGLDDQWKDILKEHVACEDFIPSDLELQKMNDLKKLVIEEETSIQTLEPIRNFHWLEQVSLIGQGIRDIKPLENKPYLSELLLQNNPIIDISPLEKDTSLTVLNIENTQVFDLGSLEDMIHMRVLNASGTPIKSVKPLAKMMELEELMINNTSVKSISPIENLPSLKLLKIYNTKVKNKTVTALQQKRFDLNIVYY